MDLAMFGDVLSFGLKSFLVVISIIVVLLVFASIVIKVKPDENLTVTNLNEKFNKLTDSLKAHLLSKKEFKKDLKSKGKQVKKENKSKDKPNIYVLEFDGDIKASNVTQLRDEISCIISVAKKVDEVVLKLESPGGVVHGYGLAAAQLLRLKKKNINLTICVDKVAASGGYMMACTANKILAAPFAILGSIGVLAQIPNFNKVLKKFDVDYEEVTAGEYKRTMSLFGKITDEGREKFTEQIIDTHDLFKEFVSSNRPKLDISKVATGEYWYGLRALNLNLTDELMTSDEYLMSKLETSNILGLKIESKKKLSEKLSEVMKLSKDEGESYIFNKIGHKIKDMII